jgi:hypothetical protein
MRIRSRFFVGAGLIAVAVGYLIYAAIENTSEYYMTVNEVAFASRVASVPVLSVGIPSPLPSSSGCIRFRMLMTTTR